MSRCLLTLNDLSRNELSYILERSSELKRRIKNGEELHPLGNKVIGILFEKPSTRTRTSFEAATLRLGGGVVTLPANDLQTKRGEPMKDTARMLGSYMDILVARVYAHKTVVELAEYAGIPIINGLSDLAHPTQAISDLFTILELKGTLRGLKLGYVGDGNNTCHSLFTGCAMTGVNMKAATPDGYRPNPDFFERARRVAKGTGASLEVVTDPKDAARGADILYTDVWVSMGLEDETERRLRAFRGYQINHELLKMARSDALVMHCLPAHRGLEIAEEVLEGSQSVVWQQAENKMFGAAGILEFFLSLNDTVG
jgi:ornithine carbamoyltransferase